MIILRKFIKLFAEESRISEIEYLINCSKTTTMEFLKALEMYSHDNEDVNHWLDKAVGYMLNFVSGKNVEPYMSFICLLDDKTILNLVGENGLKYVKKKYNSASNVLKQIKTEVKFKYHKIENGKQVELFNFPDKYYFEVIKFVTLCVCGEAKPEDWDDREEWIKKSIPIKSKTKYNKTVQDKNKLHELLKDCIKNILYIS